MAYVRKTYDEWDVMKDYGYGHGPEAVTTETTWKAAKEQIKCYRENEGGGFYLKCRRVPKEVA